MSKKDNDINWQLINNSGGANPEDYLTPKQLQRYNENRERFIDIDIDLAMNKEENIKGGATDAEINQAYKETQDPKDPRTDEKFLEERVKEEEEPDPTTDKLESRGYKGNRKSIRQRQQEIRQRALADRDKEGNTVTRGPGQVFTGGQDTVEVPDRDVRTGEIIPNETEQDQFGNPVSGFQGSLGGSIAFEVGANTLLDIFSPFLPLQSGGSYVINLISQIIRDPSKIGNLNQLEAGAAATSSLIPGANQYASFLKGIKPATRGTQLARQIGRGAVDANINLAGQKIGEGEEFTTEDFALATGFGATLGGIIGVAPEVIKKGPDDLDKVFRNISKRLKGGEELSEANTGLPIGQATPEFEPTTVFAIKGKGSQKGVRFGSKGFGSLDDIDDLDEFLLSKNNRFDVADESLRKANIDPKSPYYKRLRAAARNVPEYVRRNDDGFLYFDYSLFKDSMRPKQHGRAYIQLFESDLDTILDPANFAPDAGRGTKTFREFNIAEFREVFRPAAELLGLTGKKTLGRMDVSNVHHIAALKGTMGIYDGLGFNSPMFKKVNAAMKESIGGTGAERANLIRLVGGTADKGSPHQLAHFFLDEALGVRGENFFTEDVLQKMNLDDGYRLSKARELGRIVADSEKIALQAQDAYKRLADATLATDFKDIQDTLERLVTSKKLGYVKLNNVNYKPIIRETAERGGYNVRQFDELIEDIALIHKAVPTGSPKLIDDLLFSPQLLKSQKSFQKLVTKIDEKFGKQGVTGAEMRRILDAFDVRMQNAGVGQTGLFEDIPDNLIEDTLNSLDTKIKTRKAKATKKNQEKYKQDPDIN